MNAIEDLLGGILPGLAEPAIAELAALGRNRRFDPDDRLFAMDEAADTFHLVRSGLVALEIEGPSGGPVTIETVGPGEVVGVSWLLPPHRWMFSARAVEVSETVAFDAAAVLERCHDDPALGFHVHRWFAAVIHRRLMAARLRILDLYGDRS